MSRSKPSPRSPLPPTKLPAPEPLGRVNLSLSFEFFREREPFTLAAGGAGYCEALLARLRDVCSMTAEAVRASRSPSLRHHRIDWAATTEPAGFDRHRRRNCSKSAAGRASSASPANKYGRVHGFWIEDTFYLVWLDPSHALYA